MRVAIWAPEYKISEFPVKNETLEWIFSAGIQDFFSTEAELYINLNDDASLINYAQIKKPLIINSVITTLAEINHPTPILRINGWNSFLANPAWEAAGELNEIFKMFFDASGKQVKLVADEPGFVTARIISMIINEAYYAREDKISNEEEIDTAMKLGTNYPFGPFFWSRKIGTQNIYKLLSRLSEKDKRYVPAPGLSIPEYF